MSLLFEIHNTYKVDDTDEAKFRYECMQNGCKPILIGYSTAANRPVEYMFKRIVTSDGIEEVAQMAWELERKIPFPCLRRKVELRTRPWSYPESFEQQVVYFEIHTKTAVAEWPTSRSLNGSNKDIYTYRTKDKTKAIEVYQSLGGNCEFELTVVDTNPAYDYDWCPY